MTDYQDVQKAIRLCGAQDPEDDYYIDQPTMNAALEMAEALEKADFPCPLLFSHGYDAVVFTWGGQDRKAFLTISDDEVATFWERRGRGIIPWGNPDTSSRSDHTKAPFFVSKYIAIGDIHGCIDQLNALLEKLEPFAEHTHVFLGDYIDRGWGSKQVIDRLMELRTKRECVFLTGNHEVMLLDALRTNDNGHCMYYPETYRSFGYDYPARMDEWMRDHPAHIEFMQSGRQYLETPKHFFVHAGVNPSKPFSEQTLSESIWIRDRFLHHKGDYGKIVIHGHTPLDNHVTYHVNRINMDSACVFGGSLSALVIDETTGTKLEYSVPGYHKPEPQWLANIRKKE